MIVFFLPTHTPLRTLTLGVSCMAAGFPVALTATLRSWHKGERTVWMRSVARAKESMAAGWHAHIRIVTDRVLSTPPWNGHPGTFPLVALPSLRYITTGNHCHTMPKGMRVLAFTSAA